MADDDNAGVLKNGWQVVPNDAGNWTWIFILEKMENNSLCLIKLEVDYLFFVLYLLMVKHSESTVNGRLKRKVWDGAEEWCQTNSNYLQEVEHDQYELSDSSNMLFLTFLFISVLG